MASLSRRGVLGGVGGLAVAGLARASAGVPAKPAISPEALARDERYWAQIAALYDQPADIINLEAGYWGVMSAPVKAAFVEQTERVNREGSYYVRRRFGRDLAAVYARLADFLSVDPDELLLVRSATEALQILIAGYNRLKPGDGVLYADLDYSAMKTAMAWLQQHRGADVIRIDLPEPASRQALVDAYAEALEAHPHIRMMLLTHVNNLTGLIHPIEAIIPLAQARGVDVILDSAHAIGQIDFNFAGTGADFIGINLHKWIGAPLGCGLIYIRKTRLAAIDPFMGEPGPVEQIRTRAHTGALHFAAPLTIPAALDFHESIGVAGKQARLRYLRDLWVAQARQITGIEILTPDEPGLAAAMTSFRLSGRTSAEANDQVVTQLAERHGIFTVRRSGPAKGDCVRVSPALYTSADEVKALVPALRALV
ncbi:MAG: aminotransferase class V-fold PLP-dependent enzyme [Rhodothalassiaceae bacterium]